MMHHYVHRGGWWCQMMFWTWFLLFKSLMAAIQGVDEDQRWYWWYTLVRERADAEAFTHTDISRFVCSLSYTSASYQLYSLAWLTNTHTSSCQSYTGTSLQTLPTSSRKISQTFHWRFKYMNIILTSSYLILNSFL